MRNPFSSYVLIPVALDKKYLNNSLDILGSLALYRLIPYSFVRAPLREIWDLLY